MSAKREQARNENVRIRAASPDDVIDILVVRALSWRAAYKDILPARSLARLTERWDRQLPRGSWVAERDKLVVAYAFVERAPPIVRLAELYVVPELWRSGLGSRLLEVVLADAARSGAEEAQLEVLERNRSGIAFYEARGFRHAEAGDRRIQIDGTTVTTRLYRREL